MSEQANLNLAAIVSIVADKPLVHAERLEPVEEMDSGWQFSVHPSGGGEAQNTQVCVLQEVLAWEPSLRPFVDLPFGVVLRRADARDAWRIVAG
ncbi:DUF2185 domain-containing protein [Caenibius sp. WL]|uniref:immunity protein Imm33 domain-containing protein n=1 Tax=Caenibius sp. WL TaxID=2872646 RepID=UPI001C99409C|nr:DUF2185 domain-containing protein [Caenibius sp. WL]QZP07700.1 DUF2185 domain-containing protein [Caenibius sp. WL]